VAAETTHGDYGVPVYDNATVLLDILDLLVDDVLRRPALEHDNVACQCVIKPVIPAGCA
jgi:hypothetical protein